MLGFIFLSIAIKLLFIMYPFFGLEYEDAFIYVDVSRYLLHHYDWSIDPFQTKSCIDGSLSNCNSFGTFGGHYMILPMIVFVFNKVFGYSYNNIFIVNITASIVLLIFYFKILKLFFTNNFNLIFAGSLFVTTPLLNIFNTSALAETLSSTFIIIALYYFFKSSNEEFILKGISFWISILFICISFFLKRENFVLLFVPILCGILLKTDKNLTKVKILRLFTFFIIILSIALIYNKIAGVNQMEMRESKDIGTSTFSFDNFKLIFPEFLGSFLNISYFGISGILFLAFSIYTLFTRNRPRYEFRLILLFSWIYIFLYSYHYRSYYQVHFGKIDTFETLRYSSNYFPMACICFASNKIDYTVFTRFLGKRALISIFSVYIIFILIINYRTRTDLNKIEFNNRILPVTETLKLSTENDVILTDIPCVFHVFVNDERTIIDAYSSSAERINNLLKNTKNCNVYFLKRINNEQNTERHPAYFNEIVNLHVTKIKNISPQYELLKFSN